MDVAIAPTGMRESRRGRRSRYFGRIQGLTARLRLSMEEARGYGSTMTPTGSAMSQRSPAIPASSVGVYVGTEGRGIFDGEPLRGQTKP